MVDFTKTLDHVSWNFFDYMLERFDFQEKWTRWLKACWSTNHFSILSTIRPWEGSKV